MKTTTTNTTTTLATRTLRLRIVTAIVWTVYTLVASILPLTVAHFANGEIIINLMYAAVGIFAGHIALECKTWYEIKLNKLNKMA